jgi:hypothetical protein
MKDLDEKPEGTEAQVAVLYERIKGVVVRIENFVTRDEFTPVKLLVYGYTGVLLLAVTVAIVSLVVNK